MRNMLTEDYIMRMINQAVAVLLQIAGFRQAGQYSKAQQALEQMLEQILGLEAGLLKHMDDESLLQALTQGERLDTARLRVVADLYAEEALILAAQNRPAGASQLRALNFYIEVALGDAEQLDEDLIRKIDHLAGKLGIVALPVDTQYALFLHYENLERYVQAEAVLGQMMVHEELRQQIVELYHEFYERLLAKSDAELARAGLSRQRIEDKRSRVADQF